MQIKPEDLKKQIHTEELKLEELHREYYRQSIANEEKQDKVYSLQHQIDQEISDIYDGVSATIRQVEDPEIQEIAYRQLTTLMDYFSQINTNEYQTAKQALHRQEEELDNDYYLKRQQHNNHIFDLEDQLKKLYQ